ncbi:MAG: hypothetical protein HC781_10745, partial [Leptolyngbyaceae cyanobacterium CSU_1_4]|nr:hypothetical protein [Leptolyngbyaceae cyanobacterium CSU_1_4]
MQQELRIEREPVGPRVLPGEDAQNAAERIEALLRAKGVGSEAERQAIREQRARPRHKRADLAPREILGFVHPTDEVVHHGDEPVVVRVDLIVGEIAGPLQDRERDTNPSTRVVKRFTAAEWTREGEVLTME